MFENDGRGLGAGACFTATCGATRALIWMLPNPALDHAGDPLHRALNVDSPLRVPGRFNRLRQLDAKAMAVPPVTRATGGASRTIDPGAPAPTLR